MVKVGLRNSQIIINDRFFGEVIDKKRVSLQEYEDYIAVVNNKTKGILVIIWKTVE